MNPRIREWLIAVVWLGSLVSLYMWIGGASLWFLIIITVIFMLGGLALQCFGAHHIEITRTVSPIQITAGKDVEIEVHIKFRSALPLPWMSITDYFTEGNYSKLLFPGWRRSFTYMYSLQNLPRGIITFQVCQVEWGGLFRYFKNSYILPCEEDIIVLPLPSIISSEHGWTSHVIKEGDQVGQQRPTGNWGLEVRDYIVGDSFSRVHWKSSARRGRLQTRLLEEAEDQEVCIILDLCAENYAIQSFDIEIQKSASRELFETAISTASGLLKEALEEGIHVELIIGEGPRVSSASQATLAILEPNGTKSITDMIEDIDHLVPGTRVAIITGILQEELIRAVASLHYMGLKVEIYSVFSFGSASNRVGLDLERSTQDRIANTLHGIGVSLSRLNITASEIKRDVDGISGKEVKYHVGSYTERRNRNV